MQIEGFFLNREFLQVETQPEIGEEGYDAGAKILTEFFKEEISLYVGEKDLDPKAREIIECCLNNGSVQDYENILEIGIE